MADNDPYNVKTELADGIDSKTRFSEPDGNLRPQRLVLHELIIQTVSERKVLLQGKDFEEGLRHSVNAARQSPTFQALEKSGDYSPEKISAVLDDLGIERLPLHDRAKQVMMVTGGPGTGKSSLVNEFAKAQPDIYQNAVQINPDDYKDILAAPKEFGISHAEYTHEESSMIAKKIIGRLDERMAADLPAPHVMMDVVSPNPMRMAFAIRFDQLNVAHGTAPADVTLQRAYDRGFDADGNIQGRIISSHVVLDGAAKASRLLPNVFDHPNLELKIVDTNVPFGAEQPVIAEWDNESKRLAIYDPDTFVDFVQRQHINTSATHADELLPDFEQTPERLAADLKPYTDKGAQIDFMSPDGKPAISISADSVEVHDTLPSKYGTGFMADMAESFGNIGKNGGVVAGLAFGTLSGAFTLAAGGDSAQAAEAVYEAAVPYGETQFDLADGDMEAAQRSATIETASNIGAAGGALAGAAIGTAIMPVVGTAVGAVVGGIGAGIASGEATELIYDHADDIADFFDHGDDRLLERLPTVSDENMPPELQHLIEIKKLLVDAQNEREALGADKWFSDDGLDDRRDALDEKIERIEQMYDEAYDEYEDNGALETAIASLDNWERAEQVAQSAIEKVKETTFENEASHAHSNVDLSLS